jgi:microcystin-dependent protein/phage baseplate assembly protein W
MNGSKSAFPRVGRMSSKVATVPVATSSGSGSAIGELEIVAPDGTIILGSNIDFGATGVEEVFQNVRYILLTEYYSVPLDREFGMDFSMVDKPIPVAEAMLSQEIAMKLALYEPRCRFTQVDFDGDAIDGKLSPTVTIEILSTDELPSRMPSSALPPTALGTVIQLYPVLPPDFLEMLAYIQGTPGPMGPTGTAATITVGHTTTGAPGTPANVVNIGDLNRAVFDFTIPQGIKGDTGTGVTIKGTVASSANLPTTGNTIGDLWIANDTGHGWSWDGTKWIDVGPIRGPVGPIGIAATVAVGTTSTSAPGTSASVTNSGSSSAAIFNFSIPRGDVGAQGPIGPSCTVAVGTTTTGAPGSQANVINTGTPSAGIFNFTIPQGIQGPQGPQGLQGLDGSPLGVVIPYTVVAPPVGWMLCNGAAISRTTFPDLYALIGTTYGTGDGLSTFNIPDLRGRFLLGQGQGVGLTNRVLAAIGGEENHVISIAEMAAHTHGLSGHTHAGVDHLHYMNNHTHLGVNHLHSVPGVDHLHNDDHYHTVACSAQGVAAAGASGAFWSGAIATNWKSQQGYGATTGAADRSLATTSGACDRDLTTGGPSTPYTGAADRGLTTGGPSIDSTTSVGSGSAHNTMPPFLVLVYIIKVSVTGGSTAAAPIADTTQNGLLRKVSGLVTDYVDGTNNCRDLSSQVRNIVAVSTRSFNAVGNPTTEVNQRCVTSISNGKVVDRWNVGLQGAVTATCVPTNDPNGILVPSTNFCVTSSYVRITSTKQIANLATADACVFYSTIEGSRLRELIGDATSGQVLVRSSVAPLTITFALRNTIGTTKRSITKLVTIPNANVWTLLQIPNIARWASDLAWSITPGNYGYELLMCIGMGVGNASMSPANDSWQNGDFWGGPGTSNFFAGPVNSTFDIAYIQHEAGPSCGQLIDVNFEDNLRSCQRYYQKTYNYGQALAASTPDNGMSSVAPPSATYLVNPIRLQQTMAKTPTYTIYSRQGVVGTVSFVQGNGNKTVTLGGVGENGVGWFSMATANNATTDWAIYHYTADTGW